MDSSQMGLQCVSKPRGLAEFTWISQTVHKIFAVPRYAVYMSAFIENTTTPTMATLGAQPPMTHELILRSIDKGLAAGEIVLSPRVISPYSSMVVLVDEAQTAVLLNANRKKDPVYKAIDIDVAPSHLAFPMIPYTEKWSLVFAVALFILYVSRKNTHGPNRKPTKNLSIP